MQPVGELGFSPQLLFYGRHFRGCRTGKLRSGQCLHGCLDVQVPSAAQNRAAWNCSISEEIDKALKNHEGTWGIYPWFGEYTLDLGNISWSMETWSIGEYTIIYGKVLLDPCTNLPQALSHHAPSRCSGERGWTLAWLPSSPAASSTWRRKGSPRN